MYSRFEKNDRLDTISFTDHNALHLDVYREFYSRDCPVVLLPGVEMDVSLKNGDAGSKHLVVCFDAIGDMDALERLSANISAKLSSTVQQFPSRL